MNDTPESDEHDQDYQTSGRNQISGETLDFCRNLERERDEAREQRDRLAETIDAATTLIAAKGRHNTMLAYEGLRKALQSLNHSPQTPAK
jgi:hypothetical protein